MHWRGSESLKVCRDQNNHSPFMVKVMDLAGEIGRKGRRIKAANGVNATLSLKQAASAIDYVQPTDSSKPGS